MTVSEKYAAALKNPSGPGDGRPSGMQVLEYEGLQGKCQDKVVIITGGSGGIGVETARVLHAAGAEV